MTTQHRADTEAQPYYEIAFSDFRGRRYKQRFHFANGVYGEARNQALEQAKALRHNPGNENIRVYRVTKMEVI